MNNGSVIHFAAQVPIICFCFRFRFVVTLSQWLISLCHRRSARAPRPIYTVTPQLRWSMMQEMHLFQPYHYIYKVSVHVPKPHISIYSKYIWLNRALLIRCNVRLFAAAIAFRIPWISSICTHVSWNGMLVLFGFVAVGMPSYCVLVSGGHIESFVVIPWTLYSHHLSKPWDAMHLSIKYIICRINIKPSAISVWTGSHSSIFVAVVDRSEYGHSMDNGLRLPYDLNLELGDMRIICM